VRKRLGLLAIALVLAALAATALVVARATGERPTAVPKSNFSLAQARTFADFPIYSAGTSVEGQPLVAVLRRNNNAQNYVSFVYGDCTPSGGMGCAPPAEVQVWPACVRNISLYDEQFGPPFERTDVRGAPAFNFEHGHRLEVQTGESTIVIFGQTPELVTAIGARLEGVNVPVQAQERLPAPAQGALEGKRACG
jgi:hypothetical protein